jgi:hypothetical protein
MKKVLCKSPKEDACNEVNYKVRYGNRKGENTKPPRIENDGHPNNQWN